MFKKQLNEGQAGDNVGLLVRGLKRDDVVRGQVACKPGTIKPATKFEGEMYALTKEEGGRHTPFFSNYRPQFFFRTADITGWYSPYAIATILFTLPVEFKCWHAVNVWISDDGPLLSRIRDVTRWCRDGDAGRQRLCSL